MELRSRIVATLFMHKYAFSSNKQHQKSKNETEPFKSVYDYLEQGPYWSFCYQFTQISCQEYYVFR
uniref:Uncharacterized protein n=1 Tax=Schistosoma mansoni TaxID=6183 RepID=A0A5K4F9Y1_SCHMA